MTERTIYLGPFVHTTAARELDICPSGAIGVDAAGKIAFIDRDASLETYKAPAEWTTAKIVRLKGEGFFSPGFIGKRHAHQHQARRLTDF